MKKLFLSLVLTFLYATIGFAQSDEYYKAEVFGGYSNNQVGVGSSDQDARAFFGDKLSFNGFNASAVGNVSRYIGLKFDVSGHYKSETIDVPGTPISAKTDLSLYNFLGGVQIKNNSKTGRFKPFAHALVGAGRFKANVSGSFCSQSNAACFKASETGFAAAFGGGLDIRVSRRISIRAVQIDYNPVRIGGETNNNIRFSVGVIFH
ncbi:MAG: hypothetical protein ABI954_13205 [Pyrinomonadaceae bacterium]